MKTTEQSTKSTSPGHYIAVCDDLKYAIYGLGSTPEEARRAVYGRRDVTFTFDHERTYVGTTDSTYWNGFINVKVTPAVRSRIVADFITDYGKEEPGVEDIASVNVGEDGLVDLSGGFATIEIRRGVDLKV